jgi:hypothetical protein
MIVEKTYRLSAEGTPFFFTLIVKASAPFFTPDVEARIEGNHPSVRLERVDSG